MGLLCGLDADDVFAYERERTVRIRHKWLGITYYTVVVAALLWVGIVQLGINREFTIFHRVWGAVRSRVAFQGPLPPISSLPYCLSDGSPNAIGNMWTRPCVTWSLSDSTGTNPQGGLFIATRATQTILVRNEACGDNEYGCESWVAASNHQSFFIGAVEDLTITLEHSAYDSILGVSIDTFGMPRNPATLRGPGGEATLNPTDKGDVLTFGDLLRVAEVDLNSTTLPVRSGARAAGGRNADFTQTHPFRDRGVTIVLSAKYAGNTDDPGYSYDVWADEIVGSLQRTETINASARLVSDMVGTQIFFGQSGGVLQFDFSTLLLTLVTGSALISIAKTVADFYLRYLSPHKSLYSLFVFSNTPDLDPDDEHSATVLESVMARKRWKDDYLHAREQGECPALVIAASKPNGGINQRTESGNTMLVRLSHSEMNSQL